ncbi:hypothetical protein O9Z70_13325 [Devosia sp. YIM 151766]|nr:hypothetical protein [Devosia sp. YIM 151766]WIY52431.1 hypothetical protein O9Z70_13325 [Devosia sp. YIM 151766]
MVLVIVLAVLLIGMLCAFASIEHQQTLVSSSIESRIRHAV